MHTTAVCIEHSECRAGTEVLLRQVLQDHVQSSSPGKPFQESDPPLKGLRCQLDLLPLHRHATYRKKGGRGEVTSQVSSQQPLTSRWLELPQSPLEARKCQSSLFWAAIHSSRNSTVAGGGKNRYFGTISLCPSGFLQYPTKTTYTNHMLHNRCSFNLKQREKLLKH